MSGNDESTTLEEPIEDPSPRRSVVDTPVLIALLTLALGALFVWISLMRSDDPTAREGLVLAGDPLVVQGSAAPTPEFDPELLGAEHPLTPDLDVGEGLGLARQFSEGRILRVILIGTTPAGTATVVTNSQTEGPLERTMQLRCIHTSNGGACGGEPVADLDEEFLGPDLAAGSGATYTTGGKGDIVWEVPPATSVVVLIVDGAAQWQRPIGGVSVFDTELHGDEEVELVALDPTGDEIHRYEFTAGR